MNLFIRLSILALLASTSVGCAVPYAYNTGPMYAPPMYAPRPMYNRPMYVPANPYGYNVQPYGYGNPAYGYNTYRAPVRMPQPTYYGRPSYSAPIYRTAPMGTYGRTAPRIFYRRR